MDARRVNESRQGDGDSENRDDAEDDHKRLGDVGRRTRLAISAIPSEVRFFAKRTERAARVRVARSSAHDCGATITTLAVAFINLGGRGRKAVIMLSYRQFLELKETSAIGTISTFWALGTGAETLQVQIALVPVVALLFGGSSQADQ